MFECDSPAVHTLAWSQPLVACTFRSFRCEHFTHVAINKLVVLTDTRKRKRQQAHSLARYCCMREKQERLSLCTFCIIKSHSRWKHWKVEERRHISLCKLVVVIAQQTFVHISFSVFIVSEEA